MCGNLEVSKYKVNTSKTVKVLADVFLTKKSLQNENNNFLINQDATRDDMMKMIINSYGDKDISDYGWPQTEIYNKFIQEYPNLTSLNADPGFITHLPQFFEMCNKVNVSEMTCFEVREKMKKYLGKTKVYRGMKLTDEQVEKIKSSKTGDGIGIQSKFFRNIKDDYKGETFDKLIMNKPFKDVVYRHFSNERSLESPLNSVTKVKDVAIVVANTSREKGDIYLFEIEIDEIDLISFKDYGVIPPERLKAKEKQGCIIRVDDKAVAYPVKKSIDIGENFVFGKISTSEIKSIEKVTFNNAEYKFINNIDDLAEGFKLKKVTPEGYYELEIVK